MGEEGGRDKIKKGWGVHVREERQGGKEAEKEEVMDREGEGRSKDRMWERGTCKGRRGGWIENGRRVNKGRNEQSEEWEREIRVDSGRDIETG